MLNSCKVRRNTRTREIDQVVIDRPFTDERANVIYNYYRSVGIPIHLGKEAMREELKKRGFNVDLEVAGDYSMTIEDMLNKGIIEEIEC